LDWLSSAVVIRTLCGIVLQRRRLLYFITSRNTLRPTLHIVLQRRSGLSHSPTSAKITLGGQAFLVLLIVVAATSLTPCFQDIETQHKFARLCEYFDTSDDTVEERAVSPTIEFRAESYARQLNIESQTNLAPPIPQEAELDFDEDTLIETRSPSDIPIIDSDSDIEVPHHQMAMATEMLPPKTACGSPAKKSRSDEGEGWSPHRMGTAFAASAATKPASSSAGGEVDSSLSVMMKSFMLESRENMAQPHGHQLEQNKFFEDQKAAFDRQFQDMNKRDDELADRIEVGLKQVRDSLGEEMKGEARSLRSELEKAMAESVRKHASLPTAQFNIPPPQQQHHFAAAATTGAMGRFVARKLFLRGFCQFGEEQTLGLKSFDLKHVGLGLVAKLEDDMKPWLEQGDRMFHAPHFKNRQLQVNIAEHAPSDAAWLICKFLNGIIRETGLTVAAKPIYLTPDMEAWKRRRNGAVHRSQETIMKCLTVNSSIGFTKDWASGSLYATMSGEDLFLGAWSQQKDAWAWSTCNLKKWWPDAAIGELNIAMEFNR
jgi:hypothetical protein